MSRSSKASSSTDAPPDAPASGSAWDQPGGRADTPGDIPAAGWKQIAMRVKDEVKADRVVLLSAGVAFYALLAVFPALIAAITVWGLVADPSQIEQTIQGLAGVLPGEATELLQTQLGQIADGETSTLGWALVLSLGGALWAASSGTKGLMNAVNAAYNEPEERSFLKERGLALLLTLGAIVFALLTIGLIAVLPPAVGVLGLGDLGETLVLIARWPLLLVAVMAALSVLYRYAPDRENASWSWVSWGAVIATVIWLLASIAFSVYVQNFGNYDETYGTLSAVIVLMMWFFISALAVLVGAEINAETERQTARDTTTGAPQPIGQRGAAAADTVPGDERDA